MFKLRHILYRITGGRPMTKVSPYFLDRVNGEITYLYIDKFGRYWMAQESDIFFRVRSTYEAR